MTGHANGGGHQPSTINCDVEGLSLSLPAKCDAFPNFIEILAQIVNTQQTQNNSFRSPTIMLDGLSGTRRHPPYGHYGCSYCGHLHGFPSLLHPKSLNLGRMY